MTDNRFDLSRRKMLGALGTVGGAAALGGASTMAFFSDTEEFANNQLTAGELDLKIDWQQTYDGPNGRVPVNAYPDHDGDGWQSLSDDQEYQPGSPITLACPELESGADLPDGVYESPNRTAGNGGALTEQDSLISLEDVKPGDEGEVTFSVHLCDNPGYLWLFGELVSEAENGTNEVEAADPDEQEGVVELADEVRVTVWYDEDCDNELDADETIVVGGSDEPANNPTLRQVLNNLGDVNGIPLQGDTPAEGAGGTEDSRNCFSGESQHCIGFKWELPVDHANEIQSDSVSFDLGFYTEQCRHNDGAPGNGAGGEFDGTDLSTGVNLDWEVVDSPNGAGPTYPMDDSETPTAWATVSTADCSARWIDPEDSTGLMNDAVGDYVYELEFEVTPPNPRTFSLDIVGTDNPGALYLDGVKIYDNMDSEGYNPLDVLNVTQELAVGTHTLRAEVTNEPLANDASTGNPTGLLVCAFLE